MKMWVFSLDGYPGDALAQAEILVLADTKQNAKRIAKRMLLKYFPEIHVDRMQIGRRKSCALKRRVYINEGSNY